MAKSKLYGQEQLAAEPAASDSGEHANRADRKQAYTDCLVDPSTSTTPKGVAVTGIKHTNVKQLAKEWIASLPVLYRSDKTLNPKAKHSSDMLFRVDKFLVQPDETYANELQTAQTVLQPLTRREGMSTETVSLMATVHSPPVVILNENGAPRIVWNVAVWRAALAEESITDIAIRVVPRSIASVTNREEQITKSNECFDFPFFSVENDGTELSEFLKTNKK